VILDVAALQRLDDALTAAHRLPQACGHPKSELGVCSNCRTVLCVRCDRALEILDSHALRCGGGSVTVFKPRALGPTA